MAESVLQQVQDCMRFDDETLSLLLKVSVASVQSYRLQRRKELLSRAQRAVLAQELRISAAQLEDIAAGLELLG